MLGQPGFWSVARCRWYRCLLASTSVAALLSAGTNLAAAQASSSTSGPIETPTVSVDAASGAGGYQVTQPSLPKLTEPLRDTPQSIDAVPRQLLDDQGVNTMRDALRNVTGISLAAGEASQQGDNLTLRGFWRAAISIPTACAISAATTATPSTSKTSRS